MPITRRSRRKF